MLNLNSLLTALTVIVLSSTLQAAPLGTAFTCQGELNDGVTYTWDGGGGDANWSTGSNWARNVAPTPGTALICSLACAKNRSRDSGSS